MDGSEHLHMCNELHGFVAFVLVFLFFLFFKKINLLFFFPSEITLGVLHPSYLERHGEADFLEKSYSWVIQPYGTQVFL